MNVGAGQNQRFIAGPGPTLATYPVTKGMKQACACRDKPPIGIAVLSHLKPRDRPRQRVCNKPRGSYLCNRGLLARVFGHRVSTHCHVMKNEYLYIYMYTYTYICTHIHACTYLFICMFTYLLICVDLYVWQDICNTYTEIDQC